MITQFQNVPSHGVKLSGTSQAISDSNDIHRTVRRLLALTARSIRAHNDAETGRYFATVGKMYERGNAIVKHTVENVFARSRSTLLSLAGERRAELLAMIPGNLYFLCEQQDPYVTAFRL